MYYFNVILSLFIVFQINGQAYWKQNSSPNYLELIAYFERLANENKEIELYQMGESDYGLPIYLCVINGAQDSIQTFQKARENTTILINNAIHAGEPDGINACLIWIDQWIKNGKKTKNLPIIAIIPAYNVGGMMNRNGTSRANQNGPEEYGFRGNSQNLDLNRDFIKMDAKNTFTFVRIFHALDPDVFVDTHVSNGADYQYTLTYISSLRERMAPSLRSFTHDKLLPDLTRSLKKKSWDLMPYIELMKETPEDGIHAFNDLPRYAMGYAALFDAVSFTVETHMLKPFPERVQATYDFISDLIDLTNKRSSELESAREEARSFWLKQNQFYFNYSLTEKKDSILFMGYEFSKPLSSITQIPRLKYHQDKPYSKYVPHFKTYQANDSIKIPDYFIVSGQETDVIERLRANNVGMISIKKDTILLLKCEQISSFTSIEKPYEGHFYHGDVSTLFTSEMQALKKGDVIIPTTQHQQNFILSTLISKTEDSYFRWNFFDSYLQQKEYFSPYVFEEKALEILENNADLKIAFEKEKLENEKFRNSSWDQLYYIYKQSELFERSFNLLPVFQK